MTGCEITYKVFGNFNTFGTEQLWKDYSSCSNCLDYIISSFSTSTGVVTVYNAAGTQTATGDLKPQTILQLKIVATSTYSQTTAKTAED